MKNLEQQISPRIYVACLAAYNAGQLHGEWINADQESHEIYADIKSMLEKSPEASAEEWAVHDYEGFNSISLSEWPDIERVSTLAKLIVAHGEPFSIWYQNQDGSNFDVSDLEEMFLEQWQGSYESDTDFAYKLLEESGQLSELPTWAQNYFDYESYARDLHLGGDFSFTRHNCQTYVYRNC
ncbi:MAG: antirestriction protein ArdA [Bdellovibrionaceae bacterium]|nr:antirestriction protein ArdA [Pseudobdellovibrionaceae bacterium]